MLGVLLFAWAVSVIAAAIYCADDAARKGQP